MNNSLVRTLKLAGLMALAGATLMHAAEQATFHLSSTTHWGGAVLQPGDYKVFLPDDSVGQHQMKIEGEGKTVYVFPIVTDTKDKCKESRLELKQVNGEAFVHGFSSGPMGKEFLFHTPKVLQHPAVNQPASSKLAVARRQDS